MCGRFTLATTPNQLLELFGSVPPFGLKPRYNIAPSQDILVYFENPQTEKPEYGLFRWGLVPAWAKDLKMASQMINARSETVAEKPAFRAAFRKRRCLIPFSGFYEWREDEKGKTPHFIYQKNAAPFAVAGLWEFWDKGPEIFSATLLTTQANAALSAIHHRMPVILEKENFAPWLSPHTPPTTLLDLLKADGNHVLTAHAVDKKVNRPSTDDPSCVEPVK